MSFGIGDDDADAVAAFEKQVEEQIAAMYREEAGGDVQSVDSAPPPVSTVIEEGGVGEVDVDGSIPDTTLTPPTPTPSPTSSPTDPPSPPVEGGGVGEGGADPVAPPVPDPTLPPPDAIPAGTAPPDPTEPPTTSPDSSPPPPAQPDLNVIFESYLGSRPSPEQTVELLNFVADLNSLPPDRQDLISRIMQGEDILAERASSAPPSPTPAAPQAPAAPTGPTAVDAWYDDQQPPQPAAPDPRLAEYEAKLNEYQRQLAEAESARLEQWQTWAAGEQKRASEQFRDTYADALSPEEIVVIEAKAYQSGTFQSLLRANPNNPAEAYSKALQTELWSNPSYRDRIVAAQAQRKAEEVESQRTRQQVNTALASSPSTSTANPIPQPLSHNDHLEAATRELAQVMNMPG